MPNMGECPGLVVPLTPGAAPIAFHGHRPSAPPNSSTGKSVRTVTLPNPQAQDYQAVRK
jgi:hypothetical protein